MKIKYNKNKSTITLPKTDKGPQCRSRRKGDVGIMKKKRL